MPPPSYDDQAVSVLEEAERLKLNCQHTESLALLEGLLAKDPGNVAALEEVADNELSLEHYDRAVTAAAQAVALDQGSYMGHYILGFVASHREDWEVSLRELQVANRMKPGNAEILRCLGWALFRAGKRVQGIVTLERALNLDPDSTLTLCDLGVCYLEARNFPKAETLFARARDLDPSNDRAQECLAMVMRMQKRLTRS